MIEHLYPMFCMTTSPARARGPSISTNGATDSIVLVLSADESFGLPLGVTLYSALQNLRAGWDAEVFVLDGGLLAQTRDRLRRVADGQGAALRFVRPALDRYRTPRLKTQERFSPINYARIHLDECLPERVERAVYLDADLVVEGDLSRLWEVAFGGAVLLAVQDQMIPFVSATMGVQRWQALGLSPETPFFNSGLMVVHVPRYRAEAVGARVFDYLLRFRDQLNLPGNQEGFNAILAGRWKPLDTRWNVVHGVYDPAWRRRTERNEGYRIPAQALTADPHVIHFTDNSKPWDPASHHPARNRFYRYLRHSGFLTRPEYLAWRALHDGRRAYHWLRRASRPLRHLLGLRKAARPDPLPS